MKCFGRTQTFKRCSRDAGFLFCHQHRWQAIAALPVSLATILTLYWGIVPFYKQIFPDSPHMPTFKFTAESIASPKKDDRPMSFAQIKDRRLYTLEIINPNSIPLSNLQLIVQFPESILSVTPATESINSMISAAENWDEQPLVITGEASSSVTVEPFATEEKTGLWKIAIHAVPAERSVTLLILSTIGPEGGSYPKSTNEIEAKNTLNGLFWYIEGGYQYSSGSTIRTENIIVPLQFDRLKRTFQTSFVSKSISTSSPEKVKIRHGRGWRIPGVVTTLGYLLFEGRKDSFECAIKFTGLGSKNIGFKAGLFGSPKQPGFEVTFMKSNLKTFREKP